MRHARGGKDSLKCIMNPPPPMPEWYAEITPTHSALAMICRTGPYKLVLNSAQGEDARRPLHFRPFSRCPRRPHCTGPLQ